MYVAGNTFFCHFDDDLVSLFQSDSRDSGDVQMSGGLMLIGVMIQCSDAKWLKCSIIFTNNFFSSCKQAFISFHLRQADSGNYIGHIAFKPRSDDVILPGAKLCFGKGIL